ncbi:guanine nucleotide binding protein, alpha subunit [Obelidium mucronatum]|nr:guanine nucleotide binding protein, alpha subunit [Obelidium mucronatum]
MKIIHGTGFTADELVLFRSAIWLNLLTCYQNLTIAMDTLKIPYGFVPPELKDIENEDLPEEPDSPVTSNQMESSIVRASTAKACPTTKLDRVARYAKLKYDEAGGKSQMGVVPDKARMMKTSDLLVSSMFSFSNGEHFPADRIEGLDAIWNDPGIQYCFSRSNEYQLIESCAYLMQHRHRICGPGYEPTEEDILSARIMTTSVSETRFRIKDVTYKVYDVGGQKSQRKKWAPLFEDVDAIIFVVAISAYNQVCFEAKDTNRIVDALEVFKGICEHSCFKNTGIILFLNKIDLFKVKVKTFPISDYFRTFKGNNTYEEGSEFFLNAFKALNKETRRSVHAHLTWATDTRQIKKILDSVFTCIQEWNLAEGGL